MNFLLNAIEGHNDVDNGFGDDGGWGSEEEIDLSDDDDDNNDDDNEYDTETTGYDTEATPNNNNKNNVQGNRNPFPPPPPPPPPPQTDNGAIRVGGGMFMGRLTQFLDTVAPQQVENEDEGFSDGDGWDDVDVDIDVDAGGWADDDAMNNLDDGDDAAEGTAYVPNDASIYSSQAVVAPTAVAPPPPPAAPPVRRPSGIANISDPSVSFGGESLASSAAVGMASTAGMNKTFDETGNNESNSGDGDDNGAGWDEDDGILFDDEDSKDVVNVDDIIEADITFEKTPPPPPAPPLRNDDDENNNDDGWDDDDGLLFDDDNVEDAAVVGDAVEADTVGEKTAESSQPLFYPPPPPPPPPIAPINDNNDNEGAGWNNDDDLLSDDDNMENVAEVGDVVEADVAGEKATEPAQPFDPIPPPPPPPPVAPTNDNNNDDGAGWDDDDGLAFDDEDRQVAAEADVAVEEETGQLQPIELAPPPPPTPPLGVANTDLSVSLGGESIFTNAAVGNITNDFDAGNDNDNDNDVVDDEAGWDDDDGLLSDVAEIDVTADEETESSQLVNSTPPPPPPPVQTAVSADDGINDAFALGNDDGWDEDHDLGMSISDDFDGDNAVQENKNVVDHIPSPPPPVTNDATDDDDISQDDTLSIANSRSQQNAVSGGYRTMSNSTLGDEDSESAAEVSATEAEGTTIRSVSTFGSGRLASRKVVDYTPRRMRISGSDSLMVSGHTSVGESLDSIDEANEEDYENELDLDNAENLRRLSGIIIPDAVSPQEESLVTPRTMESGWGALKQQSQLTLSTSEQGSSVIPFGLARTPTAANSINLPNRFTPIKSERSIANQIPDGVVSAMVDHTPRIAEESSAGFRSELFARKLLTATSIDVLDNSSEGDLGETDTEGVDDIKDELYGPMVDQIPPTPRDDSPTRRLRKMFLEQASVGSTVVGQAENKDIQKDIRDDDAMDEEEEGVEDGVDESSKCWGSMLEFDNRSLLSGLPLPVVDETQYLVDHVPVDKLLRGGGASTMVMMDASLASSRVEDNVDGSNNVDFGPIVDHTPSLAGPSRGLPSITTSVATAVSGLDGDIKEDDDSDNTTVAGGTVDSAGPREEEDLNKVEDDHIVDYVPVGKGKPMNPDASVRVLYGKDDDMTQVDTIAEDVALEFGPIVDLTPIPFSRVTSGGQSVEASFRAQRNAADDNNTATIGSVTDADDNSGWDHDEPDLDDLSAVDQVVALTGATKEENNLVDRIPRRSFTKPVDGSIIVLVDPVDAASEVDDTDDDTAGNARVDKFGPVVDHTPVPLSASASLATSMANQADDADGSENRPDADIDGSATWFGASTLGGISSSEGDDDSGTGWDEDDLGDLASPMVPRPLQTPVNDHLVDHVPSLASPFNLDANASTAVAIDPSVLSNQTQDDKMGGGLFGAVVDHTPSVDPITRQSSDNSTLVTGFATNTKRDEEMDETTWQGGVSAQGEGWEQDDPELEELANSGDDTSPHLVDHVPERPESRYGDPSLVVAANPSDMSSQVEDLNQDENNFGPVVDQTPLEHVLPPPAVGSTVVALPSVLNDVSDEGDNDGSNAEVARVPNEWEEQMPNPQSGIDTDNTREQLVDAVPPPPTEQQPMARDSSSEMATVDDKSTLVPADEPKEDEFGPVVDHTPMGEPTDGIEACNGEARPLDGDGDKKPAANLDSVAPICSVESKEKQDGLDEDEFGPVVDQLPASCSKSSLAPSKGGSTVDALATVSEGEDDLNTRDGWDDDTLDLIDQASPANMSHRANHSVTWDENVFLGKDGVDAKLVDTSKHSNDVGDSTFFTAGEMTDSSQACLDETKFYDPEESTDMNGWASDSLNIADDDTPPSTPRTSTMFKTESSEDRSTEDTTDYPRVQTHLEMNGDKVAMVGVTKTVDEDSIKVDLQKLLQEEMAKSLLLEKESGALRKMVDSLKDAKEQLMTAAKQHVSREDELMDAVSKWQEANGELSNDVSKFRDENGKLSEDIFKFQNEIGGLSSDNGKLSEDNYKFQDKIGKLSSNNRKLDEDVSKFRNENGELSSKNGRLSSQNRKVSEDILKLEGECTDQRGKNDLLSSELESLRKSISQLEDEKSEIFTREAAHSAEIANLKASLENQLQKSTSDASLREDIRSAQMDLSTKVNECSQLNSQLILVQEKLRKSEAQNFKHTKDLARMTKDHVQKISELQKQIDSYQKDLEETRLVNEENIADLERKLSSGAASNQKMQQENNSLLQHNNDLQSQLQNAAHGSQHELSKKDSAIQSVNAQLKIAKDNNMCITDQVNKYAQQVERFTSVSSDLEFITRERDVLKEELVDCKTYVASLQKQFKDLNSSFGLNNSKPELLVKAIQNDRAKQLQEIESSRNQISDLTGKLNGIESEKNRIQALFEEYQKSHENSQKSSGVSALNAIKEEAKLKKMQGEVHRLRTQLQKASKELQKSESECTGLSGRCVVLETEVSGLGEVAAQNNELQEDLLQLQKVNQSQEQRIEILESSISEIERTLSSKDNEIASLREQQSSGQSGIMDIEHEKQKLLVKLEEMNAHIVELESEREEMNARIVELGSERDAHAVDSDDKNGQLGALNEELQVLANERDELLNEKESLEVETEEMLVQFGLLNEEMVEKEAEMIGAEEELMRLKEERQIHEQQLQDVKNEAKAYREQLEDERRQHEEQLRAKEKELEETHQNDLQLTNLKYEDQLRMSEEKLNDLFRESEEMTKNVGNVDENTKKLIEVNTALRDKIWEMASEQSAAVDQIQAMESHKMGLNGKVDVLQNLVDELIASFEAKEGKLQSIIDDINYEKEEIANKSLLQEDKIARVSQELELSKGVAEECSTLRRNLTDAENKLSEQDRLLLQKDAAAQDLYNQLQNAGDAPLESAETEMLRETVRELEAIVANDRNQLHELGDICDRTQQDLLRTTEQLQVSEETAKQFENDLQSKLSVESTNQMLESRLDQLEQELMTARTEETKHRKEATDLRQKQHENSRKERPSGVSAELMALRKHVEDLERDKEASSTATSEVSAELMALRKHVADLERAKEASSTAANEVSAELMALRKHVEDLERNKEASSTAVSSREEAMEQELRALRDQMAQNDDQIASMEDQLQSFDKDLDQSKQESNTKQDIIDELATEVEKLKSLASESSTLKLLEDNNMMQMQLVSLAQAFERSENSRAEVLEKVETERQAHAESLRRMTVNMKRFYATMRMSDI